MLTTSISCRAGVSSAALLLALIACNDDTSSRSDAARVAGPSPTQPSFAKGGPNKSGSQGRIAFIGSNNHLRTMRPDGTDLVELVSANAIEDYEPAWSPDYKKIVFTSNRGGSRNIFIANADMTGLMQLTSGLWAINPSFSPDGSKIVFATATLSGNGDIWTKDLATGATRQLTTDPAADAGPKWSPDGTRIAFTSYRSGESEVYIMNADGTNQTRLTYCGVGCGQPDWSPNGKSLAFDGQVFGATVFTVSLSDPGRYIPVTSADLVLNAWSRGASWSPDGNRLAFTSFRNGRRDVYTANPDGTGLVAVTAALPSGSSDPAWSW